MDQLALPDADKSRTRYHHSSQPQIQSSMSEFPSALAAMVAASSATIAVPYLSINRMAYSLSSFNQQFRRLSQLSDLSRTRKNSARSLPSACSKQSQQPRQSRLFTSFFTNCREPLSSVCNRCVGYSSWCSGLCTSLTPLALCKRYFPVLEWVSEYQRADLMPDLLAGLTIAVFHVPECS